VRRHPGVVRQARVPQVPKASSQSLPRAPVTDPGNHQQVPATVPGGSLNPVDPGDGLLKALVAARGRPVATTCWQDDRLKPALPNHPGHRRPHRRWGDAQRHQQADQRRHRGLAAASAQVVTEHVEER